MGALKFILDFIDNPNKIRHCVYCTVYCLETFQMEYNEKFGEWMPAYFAWTERIKEKIKDWIKQKYDIDFSSYTVLELNFKSENEMVNMNSDDPQKNSVLLREVDSKDICKLLLSKGKFPEKWTDIYKYKEEKRLGFFEVASYRTTDIREITKFDLPANERSSMEQKRSYVGGNQDMDDDKYKEEYLKYKKMYIELKKRKM